MKKFFALIAFGLISLAFGDEEATQNVQWDYDDERWETKVPNWWDEPNFVPPSGPAEEKSREFWVKQGQNLLNEKINRKRNLNKAKNLVIMIGDGMGLSTQMAARAYMGNERSELSFEKFPHSGLSKTYCINYQVPDSSCTATAILTGIKNNFYVISLTGDVPLMDCNAQRDPNNHVESIFKYAQDAGKATGFVTTTRVTHATLAAVYAHSANRNWESNADTPHGCPDIAQQLIHGTVGAKLDVIMGGGARSFLPETFVSEQLGRGWRTDNRSLINEYQELHRANNQRAAFVQNRVGCDFIFRCPLDVNEKNLFRMNS